MGIRERTARSCKLPGISVRAPPPATASRLSARGTAWTDGDCRLCVWWQINPVVVLFVLGLAWALIICLLLRPEDMSGALRRVGAMAGSALPWNPHVTAHPSSWYRRDLVLEAPRHGVAALAVLYAHKHLGRYLRLRGKAHPESS